MTELVKLTFEALDKVCDWLDSLPVECEERFEIKLKVPYSDVYLVLDFRNKEYWVEGYAGDTLERFNLQLPERKRNEYHHINYYFPWFVMLMLNKWSYMKKSILQNISFIEEERKQKAYLENFTA